MVARTARHRATTVRAAGRQAANSSVMAALARAGFAARGVMYGLIGVIAMGIYGFIYFGMLDTGSTTLIFLAIVLSLIPHDMMYGPQAALIAESFQGRVRYSGASLGYQLASVIAGGPAPFIAAWLFSQYKSPYAIAGYIAACSVVTLIATAMMKDYTGKDIEGDYD